MKYCQGSYCQPKVRQHQRLIAKLLWLAILFLLSSVVHSSCVVLLHGLARTENSMSKIEEKLAENGYQVVNDGYSSRKYKIEVLAEKAIGSALKKCGDDPEINFVTHSFGGILVRQYLSTHDISRLARVVMLGPPNKGSEVVDKLGEIPGFHFINGDAGLQLGTDVLSVPNTLGPANFDLGIIAGNKSINFFLSTLIPGADDGKVSIERTKLSGMNDHIELETSHPFMMRNEKVIDQVLFYLKNGRFKRNSVRSARHRHNALNDSSS
ncbi:MAG: pimeloyl-ACP methyl ester carboxylesterase [Cellvibrionaceae bacterium]|jgi:pimeloyl-ACP methyl ester carboxylesterase